MFYLKFIFFYNYWNKINSCIWLLDVLHRVVEYRSVITSWFSFGNVFKVVQKFQSLRRKIINCVHRKNVQNAPAPHSVFKMSPFLSIHIPYCCTGNNLESSAPNIRLGKYILSSQSFKLTSVLMWLLTVWLVSLSGLQ